MAVDTKAKRYSMMNSVVRSIHSLPSLVPDGTIAIADRQHLMDCYGGIAFDNPSAVNVGPYYYLEYLAGQS